MAAGTGYLDDEGVWKFGEADTDALASDLLNLGQDATSAALAVDRARMTDIEDDLAAATADTGWVAGVTQNSWNLTASGLEVKHRRKHGLVHLIGRPAGGSTGAAFTLPVGSRPGQAMYFIVQNGTVTGTLTTVSIATNGVVTCISGTTPFLANIPPFIAEN